MRFRLKLRHLRNFFLAGSLVATGLGVGYWFGKGELSLESETKTPKIVVNTEVPQEYSEIDFSLFWDVWRKLEKDYLDSEKLDSEMMVYGAIEGMVSAVGDPYTVFLPPEEQQRSNEDLSGSFEGVGIQLGYRKNQLAVVAPLKGMPAEAAGIQAGDYILRIVDKNKGIDTDTTGMSLPEAVSIIRGDHGNKVLLTMFRENNGGQPFDVELARETIVIPSVELEYVTNNQGEEVAHLTLSRFGGRTEEEWNEAVSDIVARKDNLAGVLLDMRNNPGGYLNGAIFIASEFIDSGVVVKQQGKYMTETYSVNRQGRLNDVPVVVLINRGSASASEIVAGALRDRLGATLVGERSFGKGTVQNAEELRNGTGIHITTARWLLPKGDWIHEDGLEPDIEASISGTLEADAPDPVVVRAMEAL